MASDSPRTRVDQFYASRKRKPASPSLKHGKSEKDARSKIEVSPSAKATLDSFLVNSSQEEKRGANAKPSLPVARQDPVKRNLAPEINRISGNEGSQRPPSSSVVLEKVEKEKSQGSSNVGNVAPQGVAKSCSLSGNIAENSELKQFATDFLSLYCSELQSTATSPSKPLTRLNERKRHGGPGEEDETPEKRQCVSIQWRGEGAAACSIEKQAEDRQSGCILKKVASVLNEAREVAAGSGSNQASLRKCNSGFKPIVNRAEFSTPGSSVVKARATEIPKSARGSSMFSPGEAFWNEAIEVADSLFGEVDNPLARAVEGVTSGNCCDKSEEEPDKASCRKLIRKHLKNSVKQVSPLPVKHLDFLCEDGNLDGTTVHCATDNPDSLQKSCELSESGSLSIKVSQKASVACENVPHTNKEMHKAPETISCPTTSRNTDLLNQNADKAICNSPGDQIRNLTAINECPGAETPTSFLPLKDRLDLSNWLPTEICSVYKRKGISKLYNWQVDCLQVDGVLQRRNLVYCASTSAGKSFVAEILMLRRVLSTGKIALLVLPYVSICAEKAEHLEGILEPLGKHVRSYYGNQGGGTLPKDTSVAVCTIEKANSLINRLLEEGRLSEIAIVVIDELHMVGDQHRGYLLELLLTKLRYAAGEGNSESSSGESSGTSSKGDPAHGLQIVGMSATMPNVAAVADWLQAALYQTEFRPVPLQEYVKIGNTIYDKEMNVIRTIPRAADLGGKDPDHIVELCNEVVQEGHSVLIFCSSRKGCESTARHVSKYLKQYSVTSHEDSEFADTASAIDALQRCPAGVDPILEETLPSGVAYHHAGLTVEEREIIETCYRRGLLRVLTATSTLAAGVNLPARRVIFRQPRIGRDFIDGTRYKQMAGRAGRTGIDTAGESVLICKPDELKRIMGLLTENCPPLQSCLSEDKNGMTHAILEVVAGGIVQTANDIHRYVRCTLLNSTKPFKDVVKSAQDSLRWLCHRKFLEWNEETKLYSTTPLGRAAFGSSLCPEESLIVLDDLSRAREGFVLASDLHLVYLVTPINVDVEPNWELYYERFMELSALDQSVGNRVGVSEPFLMRMAHGAPMRTLSRTMDDARKNRGKLDSRSGVINRSMMSDEQTLRVCKRFYVALILSRLVQEVPVGEVCEAFKVARGMVQALQDNSGRFASMVSLFCERLGWHDLEGLVAKFQNRVSFGVKAEIVELTTIPYIKGSRARALYKAGLRTPLAIAEASIPEIVKALFESSSWAAQEGSAQRRMQLGIAKKIKNGARKIVLEKAEEARAVAFSAFKSLGLSVPQFSRPLLPNNSGNLAEQGDARTCSGSGTDILPGLEKQDHTASKLPTSCATSGEFASESGGGKLIKSLCAGIATPAEANSTGTLQWDFDAEHSKVPVVNSTIPSKELDGISICSKNAPLMLSERNTGGPVREQCDQGNLYSENKDIVCEKGPINASNTDGGFDSFLDLWENVREFYFDIHYSKRSEVNSLYPFEVLGIAICWENSPVYYVNLPKDLLHCSQSSDCSPMTLPGGKRNVQLPENWLEIVRQRWNRICEIMGKLEVKKFTWNLKVQIQVLKSAVICIQRIGCLNLSGTNMGPESIDSSHLLLSPMTIKEGIDMCIVAWILWPDDERSSNPNLEKVNIKVHVCITKSKPNAICIICLQLLTNATKIFVKVKSNQKYNIFFKFSVFSFLSLINLCKNPLLQEVRRRLSSEAVASANRSGRWKNQTRRAAHNGCCRRVAQTRALYSVLWKLLISEGLIEALTNIEMPLVHFPTASFCVCVHLIGV
uniref:Helicase and polymerase-containing protein TEBICHI n=1 Tax=Turnera subulata TaxID=218843 RepID=A0A516IJI0_9ROSI